MNTNRNIKQKKCRYCETLFYPIRTTATVCSWECANLLAKEKSEKKKARSGHKIKLGCSYRRWANSHYKSLGHYQWCAQFPTHHYQWCAQFPTHVRAVLNEKATLSLHHKRKAPNCAEQIKQERRC